MSTKETRCKILIIPLGVLCLLTILISDYAAAAEKNSWQFSIQPYAWFPSIESEMKFTPPGGSGGEATVKIEPDDYLENLDAALLMTMRAQKGKWSIIADFIYMKISSSENKIKSVDFAGPIATTDLDIGTDVEMESFVSTFGVGYQVVATHWLTMDVISGFRYLWMEPEVQWRLSGTVNGPGPGQTFARSGTYKEDDDLWNGIAGIRGSISLGKTNWFIPFEMDIGTGDVDLTWQIFAALGYSFSDRIKAMIGFRHIEFEDDGNQMIQDLSMSGPAIGFSFNF